MRNTWIIIKREVRERLKTTSFWALALLGPIVLMIFTFLLFHFGENQKPKWRILVVDPAMIMDNRITLDKNTPFEFDFLNSYLEIDDFIKGKRYQKYDGFLEVNEKTMTNKAAYFFYKEKPSLKIQTRLHYILEKRLEEVYVKELTSISLSKYREIKQPINLGFRNVYDPLNKKSDLNSWVGWLFGTLILFFILIFGMAILRSVTLEKSNRIVEVLLATIQPKQLMLGKIIGIGVTALIQLAIWILIISVGMFVLKEQFFQTLNDQALSGSLGTNSELQQAFGYSNWTTYNQFVELVYQRINFSVMIPFFCFILVLGYLFYGTFFASLGAMMGTESDGQQFVIFIMAILFIAFMSGYLAINFPNSMLVKSLAYIPFTSPVVIMVKISQGYDTTELYQLFLSIGILLLSIFIGLIIAGNIYKKGILRFGNRLKLIDFFRA
jgi:ABC-2 type transport system permease protein